MAILAYPRVKLGAWKKFKQAGQSGDADLSMSALASGSAQQSTKLNLAAAHAAGTWEGTWVIRPIIDFSATQTAGNSINIYAGYSDSSGATTNNPANLSGSAASYTGYTGGSLATGLYHLGNPIAIMPVTGQAVKQTGPDFFFQPLNQYLMLVADNESGTAFATSNNSEIWIAPVIELLEDTNA